ncbi:MAG: polysaccharide deacetylase family protein [Acidobacteriia bacterium]|nr:polysaccharide deacetylase family protein [Terriglobia bacterium]
MNGKKFNLTVDIEPDRPPLPEEVQRPFTYKGIEEGLPILFDLLDSYHFRATFFTLGETAELFPSLVSEIDRRGHEVACHTYYHRDCSKVPEQELAEDVKQATEVLQSQTGHPVVGFRFPYFRLNGSLLPRLKELGFLYDISLLEFANGCQSYERTARSAGIHLFSNTRYLDPERHMHVRFGGWMLRQKRPDEIQAIARALLQERAAVSFYIHPWEFITLPFQVNAEDHFDPKLVKENFKIVLDECLRQGMEVVTLREVLGRK